jgi:hypothetical protein
VVIVVENILVIRCELIGRFTVAGVFESILIISDLIPVLGLESQ